MPEQQRRSHYANILFCLPQSPHHTLHIWFRLKEGKLLLFLSLCLFQRRIMSWKVQVYFPDKQSVQLKDVNYWITLFIFWSKVNRVIELTFQRFCLIFNICITLLFFCYLLMSTVGSFTKGVQTVKFSEILLFLWNFCWNCFSY